jgi:hypothetical protein
MVPRPSFGAKGVVPVSIKVRVVVQLLCGRGGGMASWLGAFPVAPTVPSRRMPWSDSCYESASSGNESGHQPVGRSPAGQLQAPGLVRLAARRRRDFDPCRAVSLLLALEGECFVGMN